MATNASDVSISELISTLIDFNRSILNRVIGLLEKLEADLMGSDSARLQGETEELLRLILDVCGKAVDTLLAMQQTLQTRIVESYFPAQD